MQINLQQIHYNSIVTARENINPEFQTAKDFTLAWKQLHGFDEGVGILVPYNNKRK